MRERNGDNGREYWRRSNAGADDDSNRWRAARTW
jgi:hypothetical protein